MKRFCNCDGDKQACAFCGKWRPAYASEIPYVPVDWNDRDKITRRVLDVIDAALPDGKQHDAIAHLIKETTKQYWIEIFNDQFDHLAMSPGERTEYSDRFCYSEAIWEEATKSLKVSELTRGE